MSDKPRIVIRAKKFEKSFIKYSRTGKLKPKGKIKDTIGEDLEFIITELQFDRKLPDLFDDHPLRGDRKDIRDCHLRSDLILLYKLLNSEKLILEDLGTHSELGLV